jgi:hypothetical protein
MSALFNASVLAFHEPVISKGSRLHKRSRAYIKSSQDVSSQARGSGRNAGKLKQLMDLPVEVFFMVCARAFIT